MKKLALLFFLIALGLTSTNAQGFLHASNKKIVKGDGTPILLKGMGLGGWLVQEGYMLQTQGFANSPTEIRNKILALIGETPTNDFYATYKKNYIRRIDIDKLKEWGFNSVRLPLHYNLFTPKTQPGVWLQEGFDLVDTVLAWCKANDMYLILDLHCCPGGQNDNNISDYNSSEASLWDSDVNKQRTIDLWKKLAERYANETYIGGYDLINETNWNLGSTNAALRALFISITNAIRTVDQNHILFIEGNNYATNFNGLSPAWDNNMAYSFHKYWNSNDLSSISGYISLRNSTGCPLWLGESGENSNQWFVEALELLEANDIGWSWWTHKKIDATAVLANVESTPEYQVLLKYWNGTGSKPTTQYAINALNGIAQKLVYEQCTIRKDAIDAMFREKNNVATIPFETNVIPGQIFAVNYDMGKNGYAYKDVDYQNIGGTSTVYNSGYQFRNDGVDIEVCNDIESNGYDVGWTATGEFLSYTTQVQQTGTYKIMARVAGTGTTGKILMKLDEGNLSNLASIPSTGGWQIWQDVDLGNYVIPAGTHKIAAYFYFGGFNINSFKFDLVSAIDDKELSKDKDYVIYQNYPNPFNPSTTISFTLNKPAQSKVEVFNSLGESVGVLIDSYLESGLHSYQFNADKLPSGVYMYNIKIGNESFNRKMLLMK